MKLKIYQNIMSANEEWAARTRTLLAERGGLLWNVIGSPGSGKTALLEKIVPLLERERRCFVLEGDVETARDAERLLAAGIRAAQIVTHGACHLGAEIVHRALADLPLEAGAIVFVENVGNLVCPAEFDIGEHGKIAVLSVAEGEEKPLKYPLLFREARAVVLTKIDLFPLLDATSGAYRDNIRTVNDRCPVFETSARKNEGLEDCRRFLADAAG